MNDVASLQATDFLPDRPFTCPTQTTDDSSLLKHLLAGVRRLLSTSADSLLAETPQFVYEDSEEGLPARYIINNLARLRALSDFVVVGFFGQRRKVVSAVQMAEINAMDQRLVTELARHSGILAYCSAEKADGDWGNLILFAQFDDLKTLGDSAAHTRAAKLLSPDYFYSTRIHDGVLMGTITSDAQPVLKRTRYWDFTLNPAWRGERVYGGGG